MSGPSRQPSRFPDLDDTPAIDPRIRRQRTKQINRCRAQIWLACETLGPHMAVLVLNDALREALNELQDDPS
jgi:hypothetical protein